MTTASSPDVSQYADLTLYDADPSTLVNQFVLNMQTLLPGWNKLEGLTEMALAESLALIVTQLIYAINRLPGALVQAVLQLFGIFPLPGSPATTTVTFNLANSDPYTVPAGSRVLLVLGTQAYIFTTDVAAENASGATTVTVAATATSNSAAPNGTAVGTPVTVLDTLYSVNSAVLATVPSGGADPESNQAWLNRGTTALRALNSTLVLPAQFEDYATANGAYRAFVQNDYDVTIAAAANGVVSVAVIGQNNSLLSGAAKVAMQQAMNAEAQANLVVRVVDAAVTSVPVTATVMSDGTQLASEVQTAVTSAIQAWLDTDTWPWDGIVRLSKLYNVIETVPGVDYVVSVTVPATDQVLTGFGPLATVGAVTVNVLTAPLTTVLTAAVTSTTATSVAVSSFAEFPPAGSFVIQIDSEYMLVTGGQGTLTWTVTRGYGGSTAATHLVNATVTLQ